MRFTDDIYEACRLVVAKRLISPGGFPNVRSGFFFPSSFTRAGKTHWRNQFVRRNTEENIRKSNPAVDMGVLTRQASYFKM